MVIFPWEEYPLSAETIGWRATMEFYVTRVRLQRNMSIRALAKESGVAKSHVQKIEAGEARPSLEVMCKLAEALNCDLCDLFKYK